MFPLILEIMWNYGNKQSSAFSTIQTVFTIQCTFTEIKQKGNLSSISSKIAMGIAPQFFVVVVQDEGSRVGEHVPDRSVEHVPKFIKL